MDGGVVEEPGSGVCDRGEEEAPCYEKLAANFTVLVLGCSEAKFCKKICVGISYLFEKKIEKRDMGRD